MELYPFQKEAVAKLARPDLPSRLIGDEMGLGKTVEAIAVDQVLREEVTGPPGPTLIVAPHSVHPAWARHIREMCGTSKIAVIDRKNRAPFVAAVTKRSARYYICHYEGLRLMPELKKVMWFHVIADEVHRIKNRKAQQTQALKALSARYLTGCSGTPADNKPQDLWSVLNWLNRKKYSSYWRFVNQYTIQETTEGRGGASFRKVVDVNRDTIPQLLAEMQPWYIRRLKTAVLPDLPDKYYTDTVVDLLPSQRKAYEQMRKDMIAWIGEHEDQPLVAPVVIAQLIRLQQFALASPIFDSEGHVTLHEPSSKLDALEECIEDNDTEQHIVFSQSRSMVDLVARRLSRPGFQVGRYTGTVSQADRNHVVEAFQRGDIAVFAGTIAAGGEGITLTASSTVHMLDRHWSPTRNLQAEDRAHRVGQKSAVQVIDYIARNTVDLGRRAQIASKWTALRYLLGDIVEAEQYIRIEQGAS